MPIFLRYILFEVGFFIVKGKTRRKNYGQYFLAYNIVYSYYVEHCSASSSQLLSERVALLENH